MFERYAIFYTPPPGAFAEIGAAWLGWDNVAGQPVAHPQVADLDVAQITATPRKYGLHGTLKAPFVLADDLAALQATAADFAATHAPVTLDGVALHHHSFVALRPTGDTAALSHLAAEIVRGFDSHRAPLTPDYIARRRQSDLSPRQDQQMLDWGYPYIFDDFHFHLTLSGRLPPAEGAQVISALTPMILPLLPDPLVIDAITLMGEDSAGLFHHIHRYALTG